MRRDGARVVFDLLLEQVERGLELSVRSGEAGVGEIVDDDIGIDAVAFNEPGAVRAVDAGFAGGGNAIIGLPESQISPPQVRVPMSVPMCRRLKPSLKASPSEEVSLSQSTTIWPRKAYCIFQ